MIDELLHLIFAYLEFGLQYIISKVMTIEGIIGIVFGLFLLGFIARIRSH